MVARVGSREPQGQVVGLGARVDEETHGQRLRQQRRELPSAQHQVIVQKAVVGIEHGHLIAARFDHILLAVTH